MKKVVIEYSGANELPCVFVDNEKISGLVKIEFHYATKTHDFPGTNDILIEYFNGDVTCTKIIREQRVV